MEADIKIFDTLDSTNITLRELANEGAKEGTAVVAFSQRKGQGRSGRTFFSPEGGNLYMSFLVRPHGDTTDMLTITAAVATVEAVRDITGIDTGIKWVNDIIYHEKKVCGIVAQANDFGGDDFYVIIGIGINIYDSDDVPSDIAAVYGSLMERKCDIDDKAQKEQAVALARKIIDRFFYHYMSGDTATVVDIYRKHCIVIGKTVDYVYADKSISARVLGIDDRGGIILDENGEKRTYYDGEIRIRRRDDNLAL